MRYMDGFEMEFTRHGSKGFKAFLELVRESMCSSVDDEEEITPKQMEACKEDLGKPGGFIENLTLNMGKLVWDHLAAKVEEGDNALLGNPGMHTHKKKLLVRWI